MALLLIQLCNPAGMHLQCERGCIHGNRQADDHTLLPPTRALMRSWFLRFRYRPCVRGLGANYTPAEMEVQRQQKATHPSWICFAPNVIYRLGYTPLSHLRESLGEGGCIVLRTPVSMPTVSAVRRPPERIQEVNHLQGHDFCAQSS